MKRIMYIILSFFIIILFTGCENIPIEENEELFYTADFLKTEIILDYDGSLLLAVTLNWHNGSTDKTTSFQDELQCVAFQDGIELERVYFNDMECYPILSQNYNMRNNAIRPGIALEVTIFYEIRNTNSPIEIEVVERISLKNIIVNKTIYNFE